jgi:hypothetical protein
VKYSKTFVLCFICFISSCLFSCLKIWDMPVWCVGETNFVGVDPNVGRC